MPLSKGWRTVIVTWIVATPLYIWFFVSLWYGRLPSLQFAIYVIWSYFVVSYFIVKAILKRLNKTGQ